MWSEEVSQVGQACETHFHYLCLPKIKMEKVIESWILELCHCKGHFLFHI